MTQTEIGHVKLDTRLTPRAFAEAPSPYVSAEAAKTFAASRGQAWVPSSLAKALADMRLGRGPAALVVGPAPVRLTTVRTPETGGRFEDGGEWSSEGCLLAIADQLGIAYSYEREHSGSIIQQVVALPSHDGVKSSQGADADLPFHTENSFAATRPDFILLLCRRTGPTKVPTFVLEVGELVSRLSPTAVEVLGEPIFDVSSPASFGSPPFASRGGSVIDLGAPLRGLRTDLRGLLTSSEVRGRDALEELWAASSGAGTPVALEPGEVLVIDNRRAAHARPAFKTEFDGQQRWLQRCLVRCDFWACRGALEREGVRFA